jgi:hypothetical protein
MFRAQQADKLAYKIRFSISLLLSEKKTGRLKKFKNFFSKEEKL